MPLFGRSRVDGAEAGPTTTGTRRSRRDRHANGHANDSMAYPMATRPSFGQWLKVTWGDILTMILLGALGLGVSFSHAPIHYLANT